MDVFTIDYLHITTRLLLAGLLGGLIGLEREQSNHPAGFRTHILVCVGSTLIMLVSIYGFSEWMNHPNVRSDPARLAAQVISGIGFLGAGTILRHGFTVSGLTTAASLWVVAAIGLSVGTGFYFAAVITTILVLISLILLNKLEHYFLRSRRLRILKVTVLDKPGVLGFIASKIGEKGISIRKVAIEEREGDESAPTIEITFTLKSMKLEEISITLEDLQQIEGVLKVTTTQ